MKKLKQQQGDVLFHPVDSIPEGARSIDPKNGSFILAEGEATGHAHRVEAIAGVEFYEKDGKFYLVAKKQCTVTHEEHNSQNLDGIFEIGIVKEFDHFLEEARNVHD